jgi:hypothetical protein
MQPAALTPELRSAAPAFAARLSDIFMGLAALIARAFLRNPTRVGLILTLWNRLTRAGRRCDRLMARVAQGTEQPRSLSRPGRQRATATAPSCPQVQLPTTHAWLLKDLKHEAALYTQRLETILSDPDFAAIIAHCPQALRLLRPLGHMLGVRHASLGVRHAAVPPLPGRRPPAPPAIAAPRATPVQPRAAAAMHPPLPAWRRPPPPRHEAEPCPHMDRWPFVPWTATRAT